MSNLSDRRVEENDLIIKFATKEQRDGFAKYFSCWGEQSYWEWMACGEHPGVVKFQYRVEDETKAVSDPTRYGPFLQDGIIWTKEMKKKTS